MKRLARMGSSLASAAAAVCLAAAIATLGSAALADEPSFNDVGLCPKGVCGDCIDWGHSCGGYNFPSCVCWGTPNTCMG
jgi:hypothetical protein